MNGRSVQHTVSRSPCRSGAPWSVVFRHCFSDHVFYLSHVNHSALTPPSMRQILTIQILYIYDM